MQLPDVEAERSVVIVYIDNEMAGFSSNQRGVILCRKFRKRNGAAGQKPLNDWNVSDDVTEMKCMFFEAKTSIHLALSQQQRSIISQQHGSIPKNVI